MPINTSFEPSRKGDIRTSLGDPKKAQDILNVTAKTVLQEGLQFIIQSRFDRTPNGSTEEEGYFLKDSVFAHIGGSHEIH